jgi:hypothetical protein
MNGELPEKAKAELSLANQQNCGMRSIFLQLINITIWLQKLNNDET